MRKRIPIKNHLQEIRLVTQRSITILIVMLILLLILIFRLAYLQLAKNDVYTTLSQKNWLDLVPLEPPRGLIYDRNGVLLVENTPSFSLDIIPYQVDNIPKLLADLAKMIALSDTDIAQFQKQLKQHRRFDEIPLKFHLSEAEVAIIYENQFRFPGAVIKARPLRHYLFGPSMSHVLGYVGRINIDELKTIDLTNYSASNYIGKLGIEKYYEEELHGTVGYQQAENDASGEAVRILKQIKPIPGKNLYLTLDSRLQTVAEQALAGHRGAIVAIQPSTGQILALVSEPGFDPDLFVAGISTKDFQSLQQATDRPLFNRAIRGLYPLASTIKPFIALEGLDTNTTDPNASIVDPGWFQLPNSEHVFHDWRHHGHGVVNLYKAIIGSCDTYFYNLAMKLGIQRIDLILDQFGFGKITGIDLEDELSGIIASPEWKRRVKKATWYPGDTVISGIGQGYMQTTPLQLASAVAAIANRGVRFEPYLLLAAQEPGNMSETQAPTPLPPVILHNNNTWDTVIHAMQGVMSDSGGTGFAHFGPKPNYTVAGKTGTAQVFSKKAADEDEPDNQMKLPEQLRDHSLLIVFAPVDKPQIALAIIVENSKAAVGAARKILDYYLITEGNLNHVP